MEGNSCNCHYKCCPVTWGAGILLVVGGLNWGLIAINYEWNIVYKLLGTWPTVERIVYGLVGVAAVWMVISCITMMAKKKN